MNVFNFLALCHVWFALRKKSTNKQQVNQRERKRERVRRKERDREEKSKITTVTIVTIIQKEKERKENEMNWIEDWIVFTLCVYHIVHYYILYTQKRLPSPAKELLRLLPFCICVITSKLSMTFCVYMAKKNNLFPKHNLFLLSTKCLQTQNTVI